MIRRTTRRSEAIAFIAFLDVMSCTIGVLMLILVGVTMHSFWGAEQVIEIPSEAGAGLSVGRIYVECTKEGLLVHPDDIVIALDDLEDPNAWIDGPYGQCLTELRKRGSGGSAHFLVRRGGLAVFRRALGYALAAGGGTVDDVRAGQAMFSIGQQAIVMPGPVRLEVGEDDEVATEPAMRNSPVQE